MPIEHKSRVKEVASNKPNAATAFNLPGSAATGFRTFAAAYVTNGKQLPYHANNGVDWEEGIATFTTGTPNTLVRTTILQSSNSDAAIDFSGGANFPTVVVAWVAEMGTRQNAIGFSGFSVTGDGTNTQNLTTGTGTTLIHGGSGGALKSVLWNYDNFFTQSSGIFFPTIAGRWQIGGTGVIDLLEDTKFMAVYIAHSTDGIIWSQIDNKSGLLWRGASSATYLTLGGTGSIIVDCNGTTDRFSLQIFHTAVGTPKVPAAAANASWVRFFASYLGGTAW